MKMNYHLFTHFRGNYVLQVFIYIILFQTYLSAPTISKVNYNTFLEDIKREKCSFPSEITLPFSSSTTFEYLSEPLSVCKNPLSTKNSKETIELCSEVFDILKNITCHSEKNVLPKKVAVEFSDNVCSGISSLQFPNSEDSKPLLKHLADSYICGIMCEEEYIPACQVLLWSYQVQQEIQSMQIEATSIPPSKATIESSPSQSSDKILATDIEKKSASDGLSTTKEPVTAISEAKGTSSNLAHVSTKAPLIKDINNNPVDGAKSKEVPPLQINVENAAKDENVAKSNLAPADTNLITHEPNTEPSKVNELNNMKLKTNSIDNVQQLDSIKTNDINEQANENKGGDENEQNLEKEPLNDELKETSKGQKDQVDLEISNNFPDDKNADERMVNHPVELKNIENEVKTESPKIATSHGKATVTKTEQDETKKSTATVRVTEPKISSFVTDKQTGVVEEVSKVPDISENKPLEISSSDSDLSPVTTTADLEKMEMENEIPESADKDQDPYNGDDGFFNPMKNQKTNEEEPAIKEPEPALNQIGSVYKPRNSFGRGVDDIEMIPSFPEQEDSHFFFYFLSLVFILMGGYLLFHNKQKIIALIVEGRHERRRRSHGVGYKKLETK